MAPKAEFGTLQYARQGAVQAITAAPQDTAAAEVALNTVRAAVDTVLQLGRAVVLEESGQR